MNTDASRYNLASKITAVGFITLIVSGNIWLARSLLGNVTDQWVGLLAWAGVLMVVFGGVTLAVQRLWALR